YKHHPTDFIPGLLSSHSYNTSEEGGEVKFTDEHTNAKYNDYLTDWHVEKVFNPDDADDYYSVLYINEKDHHAVLAHRGTDIPGSLRDIKNPGKGNQSLKADLIAILNHNISVQQGASNDSTSES